MYLDMTRRFVRVRGLTYPLTKLHNLYLDRDIVCDLSGRGGGFTMIEIIIVVVIIAIAAMIVVPMMSSAGSVQIRSAANMIAADLEYAKSMAISRGQNFSVIFDKNTESYRIEDQDNNVIPHPVKKGFDYIINFQNDSRLDKVDIIDANFNSTPLVLFDCLGSPDYGGSISLQADGTTATIRVEPVTGFILITD